MINNSNLRKCNECYERNQKFSPLFRFTKYCFLCTFFGNNNNNNNNNIIIIINNNYNNNNNNNNKRDMVRLLWPLVTCNPLQGNFSCWVSIVQGTLNLIRLSYFLIDHFYPPKIETLITQTSSYHKSTIVTYQMLIVVESKMPQPKEKSLELLKWGIIRIYLTSYGSPGKVFHNLVWPKRKKETQSYTE